MARPLASSLNWSAGDRPTPNKVDVKLSPDGKVSEGMLLAEPQWLPAALERHSLPALGELFQAEELERREGI